MVLARYLIVILVALPDLARANDSNFLGPDKLEAPLSWIEEGLNLAPFEMKPFLNSKFLANFTIEPNESSTSAPAIQEMYLPGDCKPFRTRLLVDKTQKSKTWKVSIGQCGQDNSEKSFLTIERRRFDGHEKLTYKFFKEGLVALGYMGKVGDFLLSPEVEFHLVSGEVESITAKNIAYPAQGSKVPLEALHSEPLPEDSLEKYILVFNRLDFSVAKKPSAVHGELKVKGLESFNDVKTFLISTPSDGSTVVLSAQPAAQPQSTDPTPSETSQESEVLTRDETFQSDADRG